MEYRGKLMKITSSLMLAALWIGTGVTASAIDVSESSDFSGSTYGAGNVGSLATGDNTVTGALDGTCVDAGYAYDCNVGDPIYGDTQDSFAFTVPAGYQATSITVTTTTVSGPVNFTVGFETYDSGLNWVGFAPFLSPAPGTT